MNSRMVFTTSRALASALTIVIGLSPITSSAQDRLKTMPGYDQYQKVSREIPGSVKLGVVSVKWQDGGKAFEFFRRADRSLHQLAAAVRAA